MFLAAGGGAGHAQERPATSFAGIVRGAASQQLRLAVPDSAGHWLALYETLGTHESTGAAPLLPGGAVRTIELIDTFAGRGGTDRGHMSVALGDDTVVVRYDGRTVPDSGRARITGTMRFVRGTGRFVGITGTASYAGFAAASGYELRWQGAYRLPSAGPRH